MDDVNPGISNRPSVLTQHTPTHSTQPKTAHSTIWLRASLTSNHTYPPMQHIIVFIIIALAAAHLVTAFIKRNSKKHKETHCSGCPLASECYKKKNSCSKKQS